MSGITASLPVRQKLNPLQDLWERVATSKEPGRSQGAFLVALAHCLDSDRVGNVDPVSNQIWLNRYITASGAAGISTDYYQKLSAGNIGEWAKKLHNQEGDRDFITLFLSDFSKEEREAELKTLSPISLSVIWEGAKFPFRGKKNYVIWCPQSGRFAQNGNNPSSYIERFLREKIKDFSQESAYFVVSSGWNLECGQVVNLTTEKSLVPWYK